MTVEQKYDGVKLLSDISGLSRGDVLSIWQQVKADKAKADACAKHRFAGGGARIGGRYTCLSCGVAFSLTRIGDYIRGMQASGGDPNEVWPGWSL